MMYDKLAQMSKQPNDLGPVWPFSLGDEKGLAQMTKPSDLDRRVWSLIDEEVSDQMALDRVWSFALAHEKGLAPSDLASDQMTLDRVWPFSLMDEKEELAQMAMRVLYWLSDLPMVYLSDGACLRQMINEAQLNLDDLSSPRAGELGLSVLRVVKGGRSLHQWVVIRLIGRDV